MKHTTIESQLDDSQTVASPLGDSQNAKEDYLAALLFPECPIPTLLPIYRVWVIFLYVNPESNEHLTLTPGIDRMSHDPIRCTPYYDRFPRQERILFVFSNHDCCVRNKAILL